LADWGPAYSEGLAQRVIGDTGPGRQLVPEDHIGNQVAGFFNLILFHKLSEVKICIHFMNTIKIIAHKNGLSTFFAILSLSDKIVKANEYGETYMKMRELQL